MPFEHKHSNNTWSHLHLLPIRLKEPRASVGKIYLPATYVVRGKVMFSVVCVILLRGQRGNPIHWYTETGQEGGPHALSGHKHQVGRIPLHAWSRLGREPPKSHPPPPNQSYVGLVGTPWNVNGKLSDSSRISCQWQNFVICGIEIINM